MYIYIYVCVCVHTCVYLYMYICTLCIYIYIHIYDISTFYAVSAYTNLRMYLCLYIHIYIYIHTPSAEIFTTAASCRRFWGVNSSLPIPSPTFQQRFWDHCSTNTHGWKVGVGCGESSQGDTATAKGKSKQVDHF